MFEFTLTGFFTIKNKQIVDGQTKNDSFSGIISNGNTKIRIQPTLSRSFTSIKDAPVVFEVMEGHVSDSDVGTVFKAIA